MTTVGLTAQVLALLLVMGLIGGFVQGIVGFGMGLVVVPVVAIVRPDLVPVATLIAAIYLPVAALWHEWRHTDRAAFGWTLLGRLPATVAAAWIVAAVSPKILQTMVGAVVLLMAALSLRRRGVPHGRAALAVAGAISGIAGTATGIGGPPLALVLGHRDPPRTRATLGLMFLVGSVLSLASLAVAGAIHRDALLAGVLLMPTTALGFQLAVRVRPRISVAWFRAAVLAVSTLAALVLVIHTWA